VKELPHTCLALALPERFCSHPAAVREFGKNRAPKNINTAQKTVFLTIYNAQQLSSG
jgi:hypothetical protein